MLIYKQYTPEALNRQYDNRAQVPDFATYLQRWELWSREAEKNYLRQENLSYGGHPLEQMDVYPAPAPLSKILVFIHGGYWQRFDKSSFQFVAAAFHSYNITTAILNYPLAPAASMDEIVSACSRAINWLAANAGQFNGDADQIYIAGHSAGGHLAAMLMVSKPGEQNLCKVNLRGVCALSGLFNLQPIQLAELNQTLKMDKASALRNSPVYLNPSSKCSLLIGVGAEETTEFKEQSKELHNCWKEIVSTKFCEVAGANHFSILAGFCEPRSSLHKDMCGLMGILHK
jgi:arylformamidase